MKYRNRTSAAQQGFLRALRDGTMTLGELKGKSGVSEPRFSRWMRNRYFRAELWGMLRESENRRFVELEMAANVAAYVLTTCLKNKVMLSADEILLCKTIIELSRQEREARGRRAR